MRGATLARGTKWAEPRWHAPCLLLPYVAWLVQLPEASPRARTIRVYVCVYATCTGGVGGGRRDREPPAPASHLHLPSLYQVSVDGRVCFEWEEWEEA